MWTASGKLFVRQLITIIIIQYDYNDEVPWPDDPKNSTLLLNSNLKDFISCIKNGGFKLSIQQNMFVKLIIYYT